jgi:hypothetical protein
LAEKRRGAPQPNLTTKALPNLANATFQTRPDGGRTTPIFCTPIRETMVRRSALRLHPEDPVAQV